MGRCKTTIFISGLIANNNFSTVGASWQVSKDTNSHIAQTAINAKADFTAGASNVSVPLHLYYGPSDYNILKNMVIKCKILFLMEVVFLHL